MLPVASDDSWRERVVSYLQTEDLNLISQTQAYCDVERRASYDCLQQSSISWIIDYGTEEPLLTTLAPALITGYAFDRSPDLTDAKVREGLSGSAIRGFLKIAAKWGLTEAQARGLLGGIASSTFHAWKSDPKKQKLTQDTLLRISLVIGIYKALHIYFDERWADRWVMLGNRGSLFAGSAPIDYMIRQGQPGMFQVRRMLDAWRGGR